LSGVDREAASTFSFLLAIPAIAGAIFVKLLQACAGNGFSSSISLPVLTVATIVSALVSFVALAFLVKIVKRGRLSSFSWYMFAIGTLVILVNVVKTAN
jgi:undecaprenyl-diphosphatase